MNKNAHMETGFTHWCSETSNSSPLKNQLDLYFPISLNFFYLVNKAHSFLIKQNQSYHTQAQEWYKALHNWSLNISNLQMDPMSPS